MWFSKEASVYLSVAKDEVFEDPTSSERSSDELLSHPKSSKNWNYHRWIFVAFVATAVLLAVDVLLRAKLLSIAGERVPYIRTPVPEFSAVLESFESDHRWLESPSPESNLRWMNEMGPGDGRIGIPEPERYNLKPGLLGGDGKNYGISMFHQLHCLILIRQAWYEAKHSNENLTHFRENLGPDPFEFSENHVNHCIGYLRQAIKCSGDTTIEWAREKGSRHLNAMDGELHVCRNFDAVREFMDDNLPYH